MSDSQSDLARPSFAGYWKRSKDEQATQNLTFVSSKLGQSSEQAEKDAQTEPQSDAKAKARRQQVRNAQRQHRQRKANYTKQLEMDVTKLRDDIARIEMELEALRSQNGLVRSQLAASGTGTGVGAGAGTGAGETEISTSVDVMANMAFSTSFAPNYTVSLDMSEDLGTPAYQISRPSPSVPETTTGSIATYSNTTETLSGTTPASTVGTSVEDVAAMEMTLSEEQIDRVINFVLALEHCCWDHVPQSCFEYHQHHDQDPGKCSSSDSLNGHTLMATTLALQSAPCSVFTRISDISSSSASTAPPEQTQAEDQQQQQLAWSSRGLTLTNLRRLARTLNPSDAELAPVQVWFELASLYGVETATNGAVLTKLRVALAGKVRCVVYGAAVRRNIFEDALMKVVGFLPRTSAIGGRIAGDVEEEEMDDEDMMMMAMEMDMNMNMDKEYDDDDNEDDDNDEMRMDTMGMKGMGGGETSTNAMYEVPKGVD